MRQMLKAVAMLALAVGATNVPLAQKRQVAPDVPPEFRFLVRGSVGSAKQLQEAWDALPLDSITLERTQCFGACPAYSVTFYKRTAAVKKGEQTYENAFGRAELVVTVPGRSAPRFARFPEAIGTFTGWVHLFTFARLSLLIHTQGFAAMPEGSLKNASGSDSSGTAVSVTGRLKRTVVGEWPMQLWSIEQAIDSAAKDINWTRK